MNDAPQDRELSSDEEKIFDMLWAKYSMHGRMTRDAMTRALLELEAILAAQRRKRKQ